MDGWVLPRQHAGSVDRRYRWLASLAIVAILAVTLSCATSTTDFTTLGSAPAPAIVRDLPRLATLAEMDALIAALPDEVARRQRLAPQPGLPGAQVAYGEYPDTLGLPSIRFSIVDVRAAFPAHDIAAAAEFVTIEWRQERERGHPSVSGDDGELVWLLRDGVGSSLLWGRRGDPWLYTVTAPNRRQLETMLIVLYETATGAPPACVETAAGCLP